MIAQELEVSLHMAFMEARQKRHEFITVEHLLLALLDNPSASEVLRACAADIDELRKLLTEFVTEHTPILSGEDVGDRLPCRGHHLRGAIGDRDFFQQDGGREQRPDLGDPEVVETVQHNLIRLLQLEIEVVGHAGALIAERVNE